MNSFNVLQLDQVEKFNQKCDISIMFDAESAKDKGRLKEIIPEDILNTFTESNSGKLERKELETTYFLLFLGQLNSCGWIPFASNACFVNGEVVKSFYYQRNTRSSMRVLNTHSLVNGVAEPTSPNQSQSKRKSATFSGDFD
jgi:hypothetical protein